MKHKLLTTFLFCLALVNVAQLIPYNKRVVLGASTQSEQENTQQTIKDLVEIHTETAFDQREEDVYVNVPFETEYEENDDLEYGKEVVLEEGIGGTKTLTYLITFWGDEEINRQLIDTKIDPPKTEVIEKGTKIIWREYMTSDVGGVWYWHKMRVWATKYDANCIGCTGRTFNGHGVEKGICAVDPTVIQLGTQFYVDGYGLCIADDIGGAIKGNDVDLGFKDASEAAWGAEYTDIYLLTHSPSPRK